MIGEHMGDDAAAEGYAFFLEAIEMMLFDYAIDIYRVPLHNIRTLLHEYMTAYQDVKDGKTPLCRLDPIRSEIEATFSKSIGVKEILDAKEKEYLLERIRGNEQDVSQIVKYVLARLSEKRYYEAIIRALKQKIATAKEKEDILSLARELVPELRLRDYSYDYIYHMARSEHNRLKKHGVVSSEPIRFFDKFKEEPSTYSVVFIFDASCPDGKKEYGELATALSRAKKIQFESSEQFEEYRATCKERSSDLGLDRFKSDEDYKLIAIEGVEALDAYSASKEAGDLLSILLGPYYLMSNTPNSRLSKCCLAFKADSGIAFVADQALEKYDVIKPHPKHRENDIQAAAETLPLLMSCTEDLTEFDRLLRAINLHNSSLQIDNYQNSFLCIWTALEVLCNGSKQVGSVLSKTLELNYLSRRIDYMYDY